MSETDIGLIVGSGFANLNLEVAVRSPMKTPFGEPSSPVLRASIGGARVACIARHGELHGIAPHEVNYRANVWALHQHGVRRCLAVNVVGAIDPGFAPGEIAVPHQLIDYTWGRVSTFGDAPDAPLHLDYTEPFDGHLRERLESAVAACGYEPRRGVYGVTQGPRLETAAEIDRMERDGCDMVGMTAMPEAVLARELDMAYAICALAVNRAAGRAPDGGGIHGQIEQYLLEGMSRVGAVLSRVMEDLDTLRLGTPLPIR